MWGGVRASRGRTPPGFRGRAVSLRRAVSSRRRATTPDPVQAARLPALEQLLRGRRKDEPVDVQDRPAEAGNTSGVFASTDSWRSGLSSVAARELVAPARRLGAAYSGRRSRSRGHWGRCLRLEYRGFLRVPLTRALARVQLPSRVRFRLLPPGPLLLSLVRAALAAWHHYAGIGTVDVDFGGDSYTLWTTSWKARITIVRFAETAWSSQGRV